MQGVICKASIEAREAESKGGQQVNIEEAQKAAHSGDCTIYRSLINQSPEDGICTCGYGWSLVRRDADWSQMYSAERSEAMECRASPIDEWWILEIPGAEKRSRGVRISLPCHGGYPTAIQWEDGWCFISQANDAIDMDDESCVMLPVVTRGQLLDLLSAMKGNAK
jgi:hypothetical protein